MQVRFPAALLLLNLVVALPLAAQHSGHPPAQRDSAFHALQQRGQSVMGVDQYTSQHVFQSLADGGRIELERDVDDSVGVRVIRAHMREVVRRFEAGDFSLSEAVHDTKDLPGAAVMRELRRSITYAYGELPRGAQVRMTTTDPRALRAIHEFLQFQRSDHRAHD